MKILSLPIREVRKLTEPMLDAHYREVGNTRLYKLAPDWDQYYDICDKGRGMWLVAVDGSECFGYSWNVLMPHLHYKDSLICYNDIIYVKPSNRATIAGGLLLRQTRIGAAALGAAVLHITAKPGTALDRALAKRVPRFENAYQIAL